MADLVTHPLGQEGWLRVVRCIAMALVAKGHSQATIEYGFILDLDLKGLPQPEKKQVSLENLPDTIAAVLADGIIEWGPSDCDVHFVSAKLSMRLCNDLDIHLESSDISLLNALSLELKSIGIDSFKPEATEQSSSKDQSGTVLRWFSRALALAVTCLCARLVAGTGEPKPGYIKIPIGVVTAVVWCMPLWISTIRVQDKWRLALLIALIVTSAITTLLMLVFGIPTFVFVALAHLVLITRLLKAKKKS